MWIYLPDGMLSIVKHHDQPNTLLVRARSRDPLERMFPNEKIFSNLGTDYEFRIFVPKKVGSRCNSS